MRELAELERVRREHQNEIGQIQLQLEDLRSRLGARQMHLGNMAKMIEDSQQVIRHCAFACGLQVVTCALGRMNEDRVFLRVTAAEKEHETQYKFCHDYGADEFQSASRRKSCSLIVELLDCGLLRTENVLLERDNFGVAEFEIMSLAALRALASQNKA
jgi:hypothetical protein